MEKVLMIRNFIKKYGKKDLEDRLVNLNSIYYSPADRKKMLDALLDEHDINFDQVMRSVQREIPLMQVVTMKDNINRIARIVESIESYGDKLARQEATANTVTMELPEEAIKVLDNVLAKNGVRVKYVYPVQVVVQKL